ncbi:hypothetical protein R1sor_004217 [Riccia sorocarpa]|uniref:Uncharacterized protein n=1 Tax=Riccia sorocarpa TaxID=122646 RepID=A0ABD3H7D8_9MARC
MEIDKGLPVVTEIGGEGIIPVPHDPHGGAAKEYSADALTWGMASAHQNLQEVMVPIYTEGPGRESEWPAGEESLVELAVSMLHSSRCVLGELDINPSHALGDVVLTQELADDANSHRKSQEDGLSQVRGVLARLAQRAEMQEDKENGPENTPCNV